MSSLNIPPEGLFDMSEIFLAYFHQMLGRYQRALRRSDLSIRLINTPLRNI